MVISNRNLPERQVKVMLLVRWRLDVGLARSISSNHINQVILELLLWLLEPWKVEQACRRIDLCCLQETRWRGSWARNVTGKDCIYEFFSGDSSGLGGVGIVLVEQWICKVLSVVRVNYRIMTFRLLVGKITLLIPCVYVPHCGRPCEKRKRWLLFSSA